MIKAKVGSDKVFEIEQKEDKVFINNQPFTVDMISLDSGAQHWLVNNKSFNVEVEEQNRAEKKFIIRVNGKSFNVELKDKLDDLLHELGMDNLASQKINDLKAPMPGLVVDVLVSEGQQIKKGETVVVLEAMKMENALKAAADATVKKVIAKKGAAVEKNEVLVQMS